jgi:hypothetical protein
VVNAVSNEAAVRYAISSVMRSFVPRAGSDGLTVRYHTS